MNTIRSYVRGFFALVRKYPVRFQAILVTGIALGTAFGLSWNGAQVGAVTAFTAAVLAFLTEQAVTPVAEPTVPAGTIVNVVTPDPQVPDKAVTVR